MNAVRCGLMAVGATVVVVSAALLLKAADLDYAIADCAVAAIIASVFVTAADFLP
jgi:hypothetical protein